NWSVVRPHLILRVFERDDLVECQAIIYTDFKDSHASTSEMASGNEQPASQTSDPCELACLRN
ncbi:16022_t:CDS:1, partial [Acaulospora morrowiae]